MALKVQCLYTNKINHWLNNRALPLNRKNANKLSMLIPNSRLNILDTARYCYNNFGTTLNINLLYKLLPDLDIHLNKSSILKRIDYILHNSNSTEGCYVI